MPPKRNRPTRWKEVPGYIYVMESAGYYKIGWAGDNPRQRRRDIQCGNPLPVVIIGVIAGTRLDEQEWHYFFREKRVRGEWFDLTEMEVAHVLQDNIGIDKLPACDDIA